MSDVRFELEMPGLRLEGHDLVWVTVNRGDVAAQPGAVVDVVRVARRPGPANLNDPSAPPEQVDTTPWQYEVPVDREVAPGTAHTARLSLTWGLEDGHYSAEVSIQRGEHQVKGELNFVMERGVPRIDTG
jgi:hypothetical protein